MIAKSKTFLPLTAAQAAFRQSEAPIRGFCAGRGAGKTKIGALDILLRARNGDPFMAVSPSYVVLEDTTWPTFEECCRELGVWVRGVRSPIPRIWFRTQDGGKANVVFRSGDNPESLRGPNKAGLWIDEASVQSEQVYNLGLPVLRYRGKMGGLTLTFTPKGKRHWTFSKFFDIGEEGDWLPKPNTALIRSHSRENPFLPPQYVSLIESQYSSVLAQQELAGEFVELEGMMFRREWFRYAEIAPADARRVRYWDKAATAGDGSYTAGVLMSRTDEGVYTVEDVVRGQWSSGERNRIMVQTAEADAGAYGNKVFIYFEQEPGSGGKESAQQTIRMLARYPVWRDVVSGRQWRMVERQRLPGDAKKARALPFSAQCEHGNVRLMRRKWVADYLDELAAFPEYTHTDQVDASSGAFNKLASLAKITTELPKPMRREPVDLARYGIQLATEPEAGNGRPRR